jgi:hypothetical protein
MPTSSRSLNLVAALASLLLAPAVASAANVRVDRPRMFLSNGTGFGTSVATFKQRCTIDPKYMQRCQASLGNTQGSRPAVNQAAVYLVRGDAAQCTNAYNTALTVAADAPGSPDPHSFISNNGRTMEQLAVVRDWCDPVLTPTQARALEAKITSFADWYLANGPGDVFHDDMPNVWNAIALAGLALKGTPQDAKASEYLAAADAQWRNVLFPAYAYVGDWWHEGMVYVQPSLGSMVTYALNWSTATDENIFDYAKTQASDLFGGYLTFHAYAMRPDYNYFYFGDTTDNKQSIELFSRQLIDMLTEGTGSTLGQALSIEIGQNSRPGYDYSGADAMFLALFYDATKDASATPRSTLPLARWHSKAANDVAILRSGWGMTDTAIMITCGDYLGPHQHDETGSFQIFANGKEMTGSTGYYDNFDSTHWDNYYSQHSVHANTIAVYEPTELFPDTLSISDSTKNVNDGGQRTLRRDKNGTGYPAKDLPTYRAYKTSGPYYETGNLQTFEQTSCHQYVACDVTAAYDSTVTTTNGNTAKVNEVSRQFVFFPPDHFVVFDRVESTSASYEKRFLVNAIGNVTPMGSTDYVLTNGPATMNGRVLLPASVSMNVITNFTVAGTAYPPTVTGNESGGTRLEIVPKQAQRRDYFLNVLDAKANTSTVREDANTATVSIADGANTYTLTFSKTGALGGHVRVASTGGAIVCDQDLGANAQPGQDAGTGLEAGARQDASVGQDAGMAQDAATDGSSPVSDGGHVNQGKGTSGASGGCGCRFGSRDGDGFAMGAGALALYGILGRRRRARPVADRLARPG